MWHGTRPEDTYVSQDLESPIDKILDPKEILRNPRDQICYFHRSYL